jgi:hypothetical protein
MMLAVRKIGSVLLVTLLIATTGGFSIYRHVCYCLGNSTESIFNKSCCKPDNTPSCCTEKPVPVSKACIHKDHCCHNSSYFLKISDSFQPGIEKVSLKPFTVASTLLYSDFRIDENVKESLNLYIADLPPPDTGKQILVAHHQLKIDPSRV